MNYVSLTDAIGKLTITNVTCLDIDEIPETIILRGGKAQLFPDPTNVISDLRREKDTLGDGPSAYYSYYYNLNYVLACFQAGEGRGLKDVIPAMAIMGMAVMEALTETSFATSGVLPITPTIKGFSTFSDPAGTPVFHGCTISIAVHEFAEVS